MHQNLHGQEQRSQTIWTARWGTGQKDLTGDFVIPEGSPLKLFFDASGSTRVITLPAVKPGLNYEIYNIGDTGALTVKNASAVTVATVYPNHSVDFVCGLSEWLSFGHIFGVAGAGHRPGLVPDPGATTHPETSKLYLGEDGWQEIAEVTGDDFYKYFTDGTTTPTPIGADTIKFRSSDGTLTIVATNDDVTHGDNLNLVVNEAAVDHNSLLNYVANQHIDHTTVSIGTAANSGLAGGGTIAATRALVLDVNNLTTAVPVLADEFAFNDQDGDVPRKATLTALNAILNHDSLLNFDNNEHIDHTLVAISAGPGLSGGGTIAVSRTISLDITGQNAVAAASADEMIYWDVSESDFDKMTFTTLNGIMDHNSLLNYTANQHKVHPTSTDNALARYDGTSGDLQNSGAILSDTNSLSGIVNLTMTGYLDLAETSTPANPSADTVRLYAKDSASTTKLYFRDSAGTETELGAATVLRGYLAGLTLSNNGADASNDIDIAIGQAVDSTNVRLISLTSALTKRIDASWVVGTNQGGLDGTESSAGTPDVSTWYHVYLIMRVDTNVVDVLFSENASTPTLPTNYTLFRRIGAVYNDSGGNIRAFFQDGDVFLWNIMPFDSNATNQAQTAVARTISTPLGLRCVAMCLGFTFSTTEQPALAIYHGDQDTSQTFNIGDFTAPAANNAAAGFTLVRTNTSSQIYTKGNGSNADHYAWIVTKGYFDTRGRNG